MACAIGTPDAPYSPPPLNVDVKDVFDTEKAIMREAVQSGPVVILGRAAFWVLRDEPALLSVFLLAPIEKRAKRAMKVYGLGFLEEARELVERTDNERNRFVKAVTGKEHMNLLNYNLCVDTGCLGIGMAIELIYQAAMEVSKDLARKREGLL